MLNIGIIGCGKIAQVRHLPEYAANKNVQITSFYDLNTTRATELAGQYGGQAFATYQDLLAQPDLDAVSVCTPNASHAEITIAALRAGKHVLCEKPMAVTLEECEAMVRAAQETGKKLLVGHNQRLTSTHRQAKELIDSGIIGEIVSIRTTFGHSGPETWSADPGHGVWFFSPQIAGMGVIADLGIHKTDLIHFLSGQTIVETTARLFTLDKREPDGEMIKVDDNALCIYRLNRGGVGTLMASWTFYGNEDNSTVVFGTRGIMRIYDDDVYSIKINMRSGERILYQIDQIQTNTWQTRSGVVDEFIASVQDDRDSVLSGTEALKTMRVVFASLESSRAGRTLPVNHPAELI